MKVIKLKVEEVVDGRLYTAGRSFTWDEYTRWPWSVEAEFANHIRRLDEELDVLKLKELGHT